MKAPIVHAEPKSILGVQSDERKGATNRWLVFWTEVLVYAALAIFVEENTPTFEKLEKGAVVIGIANDGNMVA